MLFQKWNMQYKYFIGRVPIKTLRITWSNPIIWSGILIYLGDFYFMLNVFLIH